jgi:hypothetical protein
MATTYAPKTISPKQSAYIASMLEMREVPVSLVAKFTEDMTSFQASKLIDQLKLCPWKNSKPQVKTAPQEIVGEGFYAVSTSSGDSLMDLAYYKVQTSKSSGKRYAKVYQGGKWVFAPGAIYKLTAADKMTAEQASRFGHTTGSCINCHKTLIVKRSVELGYGPVCAEQNGWPY